MFSMHGLRTACKEGGERECDSKLIDRSRQGSARHLAHEAARTPTEAAGQGSGSAGVFCALMATNHTPQEGRPLDRYRGPKMRTQ